MNKLKKQFKMFVPDDDGSAMDFFENALDTQREDTLKEVREWVEGKRFVLSEKEHLRRRGHLTKQGYDVALDDLETHIDSLLSNQKSDE